MKPVKKTKTSKRTWLVEIKNLTDARDNEVWKVRAVSRKAVRDRIDPLVHMRFGVGEIVPARGGSRRDRRRASEFRTYCTRTL